MQRWQNSSFFLFLQHQLLDFADRSFTGAESAKKSSLMRRRIKQQDEQPAATPIRESNQPEKNSEAKGSGLCGKHLLALIPILLALAFYIAPTVLDIYEAHYG